MRRLTWLVVLLCALNACAGDDDDAKPVDSGTDDAAAGGGGTSGGGGSGGDADVVDAAVDSGGPDAGDASKTDGGGECSGAADGTACGDATVTACNAADTCSAGVCVPNNINEGGACGSSTSDACTAADRCVAGVCQANNINEGGPCGSSTSDACNAADTCSAGVCQPNNINEGGPCGSSTADACTAADTCVAGACQPNNINEGGPCGSPTADACTAADTCVAGACQPNNINEGGPCGSSISSACTAADSCVAGTCQPNNINEGGPCGDSSSTACTAPDSCVAGACQSNHINEGGPCGDSAATACTAPDSCAAGVCLANHINEGGPCGDSSTSACTAPDNCVAGVCQGNHASNTTPCGPAATDCNPLDHCDGNGSCSPNLAADGKACYDCTAGGGFCGVCASGVCPDAPACNAVVPVLATPVVNNNSQDGNMFDITATTGVMITGFEGNIANTPNATTEYYVYMKRGTHVGFENIAGEWTWLAGPLTLTPNTPNTLTPIISNLEISIPAGETFAFYLTNTAAASNNNQYHNGTAVGNVTASDANITVREGTGAAYPFGAVFQPRAWEGRVLYRRALDTGTTGLLASDGVVFDVLASDELIVEAISVNLAGLTYPLEIYFRRGTHVGAESDPELWTLLGSHAAVVSSSTGRTRVPFTASVRLESGDTGAFYVNTGAGSNGVLSHAGVNVGDVVIDDGTAVVVAGSAIAGDFGTVGAVSIGDATLAYDVCAP